MRDVDLFQQALGLNAPWRVTDCTFQQRRLELHIDFAEGCAVRLRAVREGRLPVHDTETKTWRHLDFFEHEAYLTARVPRVRCPEHGVHLVAVAWARAQSGLRCSSKRS